MANYIKRFKTSDLIRCFLILFIIFFVFLYFSLNHFTSFNDLFSPSSSSSSPPHEFMTKEESDQHFKKRRKRAQDAATECGSNNTGTTDHARNETLEVKTQNSSSSTPTTQEKYNSNDFTAHSANASSNRSSLQIKRELTLDAKSENDKFCQASPRNCYSPRCYCPTNFFKGGCIGSPYAYKSPSKFIPDENKTNSLHRKTPKDPMYFECPNRIDEREKISQFADHPDEKRSSSTHYQKRVFADPRIGINNFKYQTSWMYPKWFDWNGKCIVANEKKKSTKSIDDEFTMRGFHHDKDGLYRLHNVCIKGNASLSGPTFIGYVPKLRRGWELFSPWRGADDTFHVTKLLEPGLEHYISKSHEVFHGSDRPGACYLDTKVMLFPISLRIDNPGHALHRFGSALRVIESAFGKEEAEAKKDVTIMYLVTDGEGKTVVDENENAMNALYEALGTSWFSILGPQEVVSSLKPPTIFRGKTKGAKSEPERLVRLQHFHSEIDPSKYTCFKEIVLWQNSYVPLGSNEFGMTSAMIKMNRKDRRNNKKNNIYNSPSFVEEVRGLTSGARDTPGAQTSFQIHGPRTSRDVETAEMINDRLRECGKLPPRRKMRRPNDPVKILIAVRSKWRKFLLQPYMIGYMGKIIEDLKKQSKVVVVNKNSTKKRSRRSPNVASAETEAPAMIDYSLRVAEMSSFTNFKDLVQLYSETDVLVGMYGAALTFSLFMPPGSLTIELNYPNFRYAKHSGLNENPTSEFGGNSLISGIHHLVFADPGQLIRKSHGDTPGASDLLVGRPFIDLMFEKINCLLFYRAPSYESILTPEFVMQELDKHTRRPRYAGELRLPTPSPHCGVSNRDYDRLSVGTTTPPNLPLLVAEAASIHLKKSEQEHPLSASLRLRSIIEHRDIVAASILKFMYVGTAVRILIVEPCEARHSVLAESSFWRMLFIRTEIVVAEFAAGKKECQDQKRKRTLEMKAKLNQLQYKRNTSSLSKTNTTTSSNNRHDSSSAAAAADHPLDIINAKTKQETDMVIRRVDGLREYYIKFCDYPCFIGLFNFIVLDCFIPDDCAVKFRVRKDETDRAVEKAASQRRAELASKDVLLVPSATDAFRLRALGQTAVQFAFLRAPSSSSSKGSVGVGLNKTDNNNRIETPDVFISSAATQVIRSSNPDLLTRTTTLSPAGANSSLNGTAIGRQEQMKIAEEKEKKSRNTHLSQQQLNRFSKEKQNEKPKPQEAKEQTAHHTKNAQTDKKDEPLPTLPAEHLAKLAFNNDNDAEEIPVQLSRKKSAEDHPLGGGGKKVRGRVS